MSASGRFAIRIPNRFACHRILEGHSPTSKDCARSVTILAIWRPRANIHKYSIQRNAEIRGQWIALSFSPAFCSCFKRSFSA